MIAGFDELFFDEEGRPNENYRRFTEAVSLHHTGKVNIHSASPEVLEVLGRLEGFDPGALRDYLSGFDDEPGTGDDRMIADPNASYLSGAEGEGNAQLVGLEAQTLLVEIEVQRGDAIYLLSAMVDITGRGEGGPGLAAPGDLTAEKGEVQPYPFRLLALREDRRAL